MRAAIHHRLEVVHISMVLRAERVLSCGVEPIDFLLQPDIRFAVRKDAVEHARQRARSGIRARDDREHTVVIELARGWGRLVREVFVVLYTTVSLA